MEKKTTSFFKSTGVKAMFLLFAILFLINGSASATHFRFSLVTASRLSETSTTVTYQLNVSLSWRLGTAPAAVPFTISGGNTGGLSVDMTTVTDPTGTWDNSTGTTTVTLNKTTTPTKIEFTGFSKLSTIANNATTNWDVYTIINTGAPGSTPVSSLPAIINVAEGDPTATFPIPASDIDAGSTITYGYPDLTTGALAGETEPTGFSVDPSSGLATFNTLGMAVGAEYNAMVTVTDNNGNQIELDFLINIVSASAPPTFDYSVTPANGAVFSVVPGAAITFPLKAVNAGSGTTVSLSASGLNSYITSADFSPAMPATGNPSSTTFTFTPSASQIGTSNVLNFIATNNYSAQTTTSVILNVVSEPAPSFVGSTPGEGTVRSILAGLAHLDTITAQSPLGSNVSILSATVPASGTFSPTLPTTGANPGQTIFSWTPTPADFGMHNCTVQSAISSSPTIITTRHYTLIANDLPVFTSSPVTTVAACSGYVYNVVATDADVPYGDTLGIVQAAPLPAWLTLSVTGTGTAVLSGTPANTDAGTYSIVLGAEDMYHHNYSPVLQTFTVTVVANAITGTPQVCVGSTTALSDAITGGTWSSSNTGLATVGSTGIVTGVAPGSAVITYNAGSGCVASATVDIEALPTVSGISGAGTVCAGSSVALTDGTTGGTWSSSNTSIASVGSSGSVIGVTAGAATISYKVTNSAACSNTVTAGITVLPSYTITASAGAHGSISPAGTSNICSGSNATYTIAASSGYHISSVMVDGSSVGTPGSYTFTSVSTGHTISATFVSTSCTAPAITSCTGDITASNTTGVCGKTVTYSAVTATGTTPVITYSQSSGTLFSVGVTTVTVTATNACGTATRLFNVTVSDTQHPTITAPAAVSVNVCSVPAAVSLGTPVTADNCGVASVTNDAPALFPSGTTTVHWTVTDLSGNTTTANQTVKVHVSSLSVTATKTNENCYSGSTGSIATSVSGGTPGYMYSWSTGATTSGISGIAAGTYSLTVTDAGSCAATGIYTITQPAAVSIDASVINVSCNGSNTGSIGIGTSGGTSPYTYSWSTGATSANILHKTAGTYSLTVTDHHGCTASGSYTITQPAPLTASIGVSPVTTVPGQAPYTIFQNYGPQSVTLTASVTGGTSGYSYSWYPSMGCSGGGGTSSVSVSPTSSTTYELNVTDAQGCFAVSAPQVINYVTTNCDANSNGGNSCGNTFGFGFGFGNDCQHGQQQAPKICLCHNGTTISVDSADVAAHLAGGDYLGSCTGNDDDDHHGCRTSSTGSSMQSGAATQNATVISDMIKAYPNPTNGVFSLEVPTVIKDATISVTDLAGKTVDTYTLTENTGSPVQFHLKNVVPGMYLVKVSSGANTYMVKLMVQ